MKKFFTITLAVIVAFIFVSCSDGKNLEDLIDTNTDDQADSGISDQNDTDQGGETNNNTTEPTDNTDPTTNPTDEPTNPTDEPTNPTDEPTNPTYEPTNPTDEPTNPTDEPTNPTDEPTDPTTDPTDPTTDPTDPTTDPTDPTTDPTDPTTDPTDPTTDPTDPTTDPTDPTTDPTDPTTDPTDPTSDCVGISIDWNTFVLYEGAFDADITMGNPDKIDDLTIEFRQYDNDKVNPGTYDLGRGNNKNYLTCTECVSVAQDCTLLDGFYLDECTYYFQESGTLTVSEVDLDGNIKGSISAKLREAHESGYAEDYTLITDANGACVEIEAGFFESTKDCIELELNKDVTFSKSGSRLNYSMTYDKPTGNYFEKDIFQMQLYNLGSNVLGEHSLIGTNFGDASGIFFVIYEDNGSGTKFFQKSGNVNITSYNSSNNKITAELSDLVLEEVTIQSGSQTSAKVPYGRCLKIKNDTTISY